MSSQQYSNRPLHAANSLTTKQTRVKGQERARLTDHDIVLRSLSGCIKCYYYVRKLLMTHSCTMGVIGALV